MDSKKVLGNRINAALAMRDKKQKELAHAIGVTDNTISYFCSGKRAPNFEQIKAIAKELNVSSDYLLGLSGTPSVKEDIQAACKTTGLSTSVIEWLKSITGDPVKTDTLNSILENKTFQAILPYVDELKNVQIAAEMDRSMVKPFDITPVKEIGYGQYVVGGHEYLSVLEYRIAEFMKMVIDEVTSPHLEEWEVE